MCKPLPLFFISDGATSPRRGGAMRYYDLELHAKLIQLLERQTELMEFAFFVRLTDEEVSEYEAREKQISELLGQLGTLKAAARKEAA
jgi:hypothetical protein